MHTLFDYFAIVASILGCLVPVAVFGLDKFLSARSNMHKATEARFCAIENRVGHLERWKAAISGDPS